jgi:FAD/FMN-containing dehydrogenase
MTDITYSTQQGREGTVMREALDKFRATLRGPLCLADDAGYDDARALWNGMIDKRPALVARCTGPADVRDAVRFARTHDMRLSVRGGGHNIAGTALCDGGLLVDLSPMRLVHADPGAQRARVAPGCTWADVDRETQAFGQAVPSGIVSTTGVAGLTLGGGFGWLTRRWGLTCDHLVSADVVTADGEFLQVTEEHHPDLLWALRGGGGNFGVVTSFEFRTRPLRPEVLAGMRVYPFERAREVAQAYRELTASAPEELGSLLMMRKAPPAPFLPESLHGAPVAAIVTCWCGDDPEAGRAALAPLDALGEPVADLVAPKPFRVHQTMLDAAQPHGRRYYWKSEYMDALPDAAIDAMIDHIGRITSPHSSMLFMHLGGTAARGSIRDSAAGNRDAGFVFNAAGSWEGAAEDARHVAWVRDFWTAMRPFSNGGVYANFLTQDESQDASRIRAAWGPALHDRLATLKAQYDPDNVFQSNINIAPVTSR